MRSVPGFALILCLAAVQMAPAQDGQSRALLLELGADTFAVERYIRTATKLEGELIGHAFGRVLYEMTFDDDVVTELSLQTWLTGRLEGSPIQTARITFVKDTAVVSITMLGGTIERRFATQPGAFPFINPSFAQIEHLVLSQPEAATETEFPLFLVSAGITVDASFERVRPDSVIFTVPGAEARLILDAEGISYGSLTGQPIIIRRDDDVEFPRSVVAPPDYSAPADAPYTAENVAVPAAAGHNLRGTLTLPEGGGPHPAVITISGSGPQDRDQAIPGLPGYRPFRDVADALGHRGIAVLRLDDRGVGESGGLFFGATSEDFADDVRDAVAFLRERPDIDAQRVGLVGHSEGGLIAPMVAAGDSLLGAIVLIASPAVTGAHIMDFQIRSAIATDTSLTSAAMDSLFVIASARLDTLAEKDPWMAFFLEYDPLLAAREVTQVPVLILHGETDGQVPVEQAAALADTFRATGNAQVSVETFPDVNHLLLRDPEGRPSGYMMLIDRSVVREVLDSLGSWLEETLKR
jgi:uncharacterized protein